MGGMVDSVGGFLGLSDGPKAPDGSFKNDALNRMQARDAASGNAGLAQRRGLYGTGQMSLKDAIGDQSSVSLPGYGTEDPNLGTYQQYLSDLATDPLSGSRFATEQVQGNPLLSGLFGQGGQFEQAQGEATRLQNQGFQLTPEDHEAYGQASGDIARMFGQQEQGVSQSLADRGLAAGGSGAAIAGFSGLQGNKNEMLAKAQMDIADKRMQNTTQRLGQTRQYVTQLGGQAQSAIQDQYGRQVQGAQMAHNNLRDSAQAQMGQNSSQNAYGLDKAGFDSDHKPANAADYYLGGMGKNLYSAGSGDDGKQAAKQGGSMMAMADGGYVSQGSVVDRAIARASKGSDGQGKQPNVKPNVQSQQQTQDMGYKPPQLPFGLQGLWDHRNDNNTPKGGIDTSLSPDGMPKGPAQTGIDPGLSENGVPYGDAGANFPVMMQQAAPVQGLYDGGSVMDQQMADASRPDPQQGGGGGGGGASSMMSLLPMLMALKNGGVVPGHAPVKGDSTKNDVMPAALSPGEVVVPRTVVSKGSKEAGKFVADAKKKAGK